MKGMVIYMTERDMWIKEVERLRAELVNGYKTPKEEAAILRRIEMIEYKYL